MKGRGDAGSERRGVLERGKGMQGVKEGKGDV